MFISENMKKTITLLYETEIIDPITYKTKVEEVEINGVFLDFTDCIDKNKGLNTEVNSIFLCVPINEYQHFLKKNMKFYIGTNSDKLYTITKVHLKDYGYNPHLEIFGR